MGFLGTAGAPLTLEQLQKIKDYIKKHGIIQFLNLYLRHKDRVIPKVESQIWGDETEHHLVVLDHKREYAKLLLNSADIVKGFNFERKDSKSHTQPEYGAFMLEAVPASPFKEINISTLSTLETHFKERSKEIAHYLSGFGPILATNSPNFPLLGVGDYATQLDSITEYMKHNILISKEIEEKKLEEKKEEEPEDIPLSLKGNKYSESLFTFDKAINPHPRFPTLSRNIRERRGEKVCITVPLFIDSNTKVGPPTKEDPFPGYIYMDSMQFGMGMNCLQLTYQAQCINHARYLYDQLMVLAPILAALSASTPIYRGKLADQDMRFNVIGASVDCRNPEERDPTNPKYIPKSRYSHCSHYLSKHASVMSHHNDTTPLKVDPEIMDTLAKAGVDDRLSYHIASLFVRDPMVVFEKAIVVDDSTTTCHFENLQSTNWNSMRFKPPPALDSSIGWRVEFRPLDLQLTDYENAAFSALVSLLVKLLTEYDVNFIIPISKGDINMERAHHRDAVLTEKFFFRKNIISSSDYRSNILEKTDFLFSNSTKAAEKEELVELTIAEILAGKPELGYKGILPLLYELINTDSGSEKQKETTRNFLEFLLGRAKGTYKTGARYIRDFVLNHSDYKKDSIISEKINYDLLCHLDNMKSSEISPSILFSAVPTYYEPDYGLHPVWSFGDMEECLIGCSASQ